MKTFNNMKVAFILNLSFSLFELIGGLITNSISIISDSIHDFGDAISLLISLFLDKKSHKKPTKIYTYGYRMYSVLGALITSIILLIGSLYVIYKSAPRLMQPVEVDHTGMLILAVIGVVINGYVAYKTMKTSNLNEKSVSLHMLEDALGWVAVLIGSIIIKITGWYVIDPLLSITIAIFLIYHVMKELKEILNIFLRKSPENVDIDKIKLELLNVKNITDIHHIHVWSMDNINNYATLHVKVSEKLTFKELDEVKDSVRKIIKKNNIDHATIEVDFDKCQEATCKYKDE